MNQLAASKPHTRRHWLVSLGPSALEVVEARRGLLGWHVSRVQRQAIDARHDLVPQLERAMAALVKAWLPRGRVEATVVLAPDMLGVALADAGAQDDAAARAAQISAALPFAPNDLSLGLAQVIAHAPAGASADKWSAHALWLHADWQLAVRQTLAASGVDAVELLARAQLFPPSFKPLGQRAQRLAAVLEADDSYEGVYLHVFGPGGAVLRTTCLPMQPVPELGATVAAELEAIRARIGTPGAVPVYLTALARERVQLPALTGFVPEALAGLALPSAMLALWRSGVEGIELRPTWPRLQQRLQAASLGFGVLGALAYGAMVWHGRQLDTEIEQLRSAERKARPVAQTVQRMREQALFMSSTVAGSATVGEPLRTRPIDAIGDLSTALPSHATVAWLRASATDIAVAGLTSKRDARFPDGFSLAGFEPARATSPPDFVSPARHAFAFEAKRRPDPPAPVSPGSAAAAGAAAAGASASSAPASSAASASASRAALAPAGARP